MSGDKVFKKHKLPKYITYGGNGYHSLRPESK
jgi:hypothetical protein